MAKDLTLQVQTTSAPVAGAVVDDDQYAIDLPQHAGERARIVLTEVACDFASQRIERLSLIDRTAVSDVGSQMPLTVLRRGLYSGDPQVF